MTELELPDVITVSETRLQEIAADRADLSVTIAGSSLFAGEEALKKAREVAQLVGELTAYGLPPDAVSLQGVSADVQTGVLSKSSQAKYRLRVHCADLSELADLVGIIAAQKNTSLTALEWGYPDDDAKRDEWLLACIARVNAKAARIADALGVRLLGVRSFTEQIYDREASRPVPTLSDAGPGTLRRARVSGEELGMEVSHTKKLQVMVTAEYRVSDYAAMAGPMPSSTTDANVS